jgi:acyl-CoA reductase-like NAD-dependent aldehyde dehydrogenase
MNQPPPAETPAAATLDLTVMRQAQRAWARTDWPVRLGVIRRARQLIASEARELALVSAQARQRPLAETLVSEVLPLADACRFLERRAAKILAPKKIGVAGRPLWLTGVQGEIRREPYGLVLIIGPSNYPLLLPAIQALQALAAGNAVLIKPGAGGRAVALAFAAVMANAGLPPALLRVLPETTDAARIAFRSGVDKVVLTGSAETGAAVLAELATQLIPATMELSGCDAMFVRADADLDLVVNALLFGLRLNAGATCIAPRRVFVHAAQATELEGRLARALETENQLTLTGPAANRLRPLAEAALAAGAHLIGGKISATGVITPLVLGGTSPTMSLLNEDVFAPVVSLVTVADDAEALSQAGKCRFALGASIFSGDEAAAEAFAAQINAGTVVINDVIAPIADPRVPFGGRGRSGFGSTRGAEGLLEMTVPKVIITRRGRARPHFAVSAAGDENIFAAYLRLVHGRGFNLRWAAGKNLWLLLVRKYRNSKSKEK